MKNNKNLYTAPSFEIIEASIEDVISTSFFNGKDHEIGTADHEPRAFEF